MKSVLAALHTGKWSAKHLNVTEERGHGGTNSFNLSINLVSWSETENHQPKARQSTFYVEQLATRPDAAMAVLNARLGRRHWQDWKLSRILIINSVFMYQLLQDSIKDIIQSPNGDLEIYESSADCIVLWGKYWR